MENENSMSGINQVLLQYLYEVTPEELIVINSHTRGFSDEQL